MIKRFARYVVVRISWGITRLYIRKTKPVIIGVVGSIGKTGTKRAIASILSSSRRVAWQDGNYNDLVSVPLVIFGFSMPSLLNPLAWLGVWMSMLAKFFTPAPEVVILELGTDGPGQILAFGRYLHLDYAVVTAITPEHMEYFGSLDSVAKEELSVLDFANNVYVGPTVVPFITNKPASLLTYGQSDDNDRWFMHKNGEIQIHTSSTKLTVKPKLEGVHQFEALVVASDIALQLGLLPKAIEQAAGQIQSMPGRMNVLRGKDGSTLIDDTYNASPDTVIAALKYLYQRPEKQKIAVLGNMNEMGDHASVLHKRVGQACDPKKLKLILTIGPDANTALASAARERGCVVKQFSSPYAIARYLLENKITDSAILFKGSQNGVFLEEAIKPLLQKPSDSQRLVRQTAYWQKVKRAQFEDYTP